MPADASNLDDADEDILGLDPALLPKPPLRSSVATGATAGMLAGGDSGGAAAGSAAAAAEVVGELQVGMRCPVVACMCRRCGWWGGMTAVSGQRWRAAVGSQKQATWPLRGIYIKTEFNQGPIP